MIQKHQNYWHNMLEVVRCLCFQIDGLQMLLTGPDCIVAAGVEHFINLGMEYNSQNRAQTRMSIGPGQTSQTNLHSRVQNKRDRLAKTSKCTLWQGFVSVTLFIANVCI